MMATDPDRRPHHRCDTSAHRTPGAARSSWVRTWVYTWTLVSGVLALLWLLLRSGSKPSRFVYPCQQAAFSAAALAFGGPLVATLVSARRRLAAELRRPGGIAVAALGIVATIGLWSYLSRAQAYMGSGLEAPADYRAQIYHVTDCPPDPIEDRFVGLDNLISLMGREGLKLYQSASESPVAGPEGIIAADDTVVIKINYQWDQRGGTNTDVLRGLIWRLVNHPDTFAGEIVVCENAQFNSVNNFDRGANNAQDTTQSPHDVVVDFQGLGYDVSHYDWTVRRNTQVAEYSTGNMTDGYIVYGYDSVLHGRVSYPKFQTTYGTYISLKYGIWDPGSETYDREHLKFINIPVLKSHHATYGATVSVKHYMGVVTRELSTSSHSAIHYGILGALLGEIQIADLNLVDAIWINADPYDGPWTDYTAASRRNELLASTDPVAVDRWAVANILIPAFIRNGYSPPWPYPSADPDLPTSSFRQYLDHSMDQILQAGYNVTNDYDAMDVYHWNGDGDFDGDSYVDVNDYDQFALCFTGPDGGPVGAECESGDFDGDRDVDCEDWTAFLEVWTGPGEAPSLPACSSCPTDLDGDAAVTASDLAILLGGWGPCAGCPGELNGDGIVDAADLALLLGSWGPC